MRVVEDGIIYEYDNISLYSEHLKLRDIYRFVDGY